jgi:hypothetical protein
MVVCWPFYQSGVVPRHDLAHLEDLALNRHDLAHLEEPFLEEEVPAVIRDIAGEKAPGPDSFIGVFLKRSWLVIKEDLMSAFYFFLPTSWPTFSTLEFGTPCSAEKT